MKSFVQRDAGQTPRRFATFVIQVLTLALGILCFVVAMCIFLFWTSADSHFENADRTFVITSEWEMIDGGESSGGAVPLTPHRLASHLDSDFPQLAAIARVTLLDNSVPVRTNEHSLRLRAVAADPEFLRIFNLPFLHGNAQAALDAPRSVVLTRDAARNLFGDTDVVGRTLTLYSDQIATITGVVGSVPEPSHIGGSITAPLQFDVLVSRDLFESRVARLTSGHDTDQLPADWFYLSNTTYVLLPEDGSLTADQLRLGLPEIVSRHIPEAQRQLANFTLDVIPVGDLLEIAVRDTLFPQQTAISPPTLVVLLGSIVLIVACLNFANLAAAQSISRDKEIALRKTLGASAIQVSLQFLREIAAQTITAVVLAGSAVFLVSPVILGAMGIDLVALLLNMSILSGVIFSLLLVAVVTAVAGAYPIFVMAALRPADVFRATAGTFGSRTFIYVLIAVQFALSAFLMIVLAVVFLQGQALHEALDEISGESMLVIENNVQTTGVQQETIRQELLLLPHVESVTAMSVLPWTDNPSRMPLASSPSSTDVEQVGAVHLVGDGFFNTLGIELIAGRVFDARRSEDIAATSGDQLVGVQNLIVSRSLAEGLGYDEVSLAVGKSVYMPDSVVSGGQARPFNIIGVVEDKILSIASRFGKISQVYLFSPNHRFLVVRLAGTNISDATVSIDQLWQRLSPDIAIQRRFVSEYFDENYAAFSRVSQTFTTLSLLACLLSVIGLYAMATLMTRRRVREVAIRKAVGADRHQIVLMLIKNFSVPVILANIVAWPFAYSVSQSYLNVFVDPITLNGSPFGIVLFGSLVLAWMAVLGTALSAASTPPQIVMRSQ
ncbi:MAG TPA: hypothetical protein DD407_08780 [Pseudohongiella sp.]|nr:hypothetical protein [Gammaproteobacteria bacterium]HBN15123.1 hypothetical protein [Pseudohongiella sp.]|tara:strand:- start:3233 stop:5746 length:2514 start_codon:yes stop_codon:yes gene_type:complete